MAKLFSALVLAQVLLVLCVGAASAEVKTEKCEKELTVRTLYQAAQEKARLSAFGESVDWRSLSEDLKKDGLSDHEIALVAAADYLRPALTSGLLEDALRVALLTLGVRPNQIKNTLEYIRNHALPADEVEKIVDRVVEVLHRENLPPVRLENMTRVTEIQKKYRLSSLAYQVLATTIHSNDPELQTKLRIGILGAISNGDNVFLSRVSSPWFWVMWRDKRVAGRWRSALDPRSREPSEDAKNRVRGPLAQTITALESIYASSQPLPDDRRAALASAVEKAVSEGSVSISTSDMLRILKLLPRGLNWGTANCEYSWGWLKKPWNGFEPTVLRAIGIALKKVSVRDLTDVGGLGKAVLEAVEGTYEWETKKAGFKRDVYAYINHELARIAALPLNFSEPPIQPASTVSAVTEIAAPEVGNSNLEPAKVR